MVNRIPFLLVSSVDNVYFKFFGHTEAPPLKNNSIHIWVRHYSGDMGQMIFPFAYNTFEVSTKEEVLEFRAYVNSIRIGCTVAIAINCKLEYSDQESKKLLLETFGLFGGSKISFHGADNPYYCLLSYKGEVVGNAIEAYGNKLVKVEKEVGKNKDWDTKLIEIFNYGPPNSHSLPNADTQLLINGFLSTFTISGKRIKYKVGINVVTFTISYEMEVEKIRAFDTDSDPNESKKLAAYLKGIDVTALTLIFTVGETRGHLSKDVNKNIKLFGSKLFGDYCQNSHNTCWFLFGRKDSKYSFESTSTTSSCSGSYYFTLSRPDIDKEYEDVDDSNLYLWATSNNHTTYYKMTNIFGDIRSKYFFEYTSGFAYVNVDLNDCTVSTDVFDGFDIAPRMVSRIENTPIGNLVMVLSNNLDSSFTMTEELIDAFSTIGSSSIEITKGSPYCLIGRKGSSGGCSPELSSLTGPVSLLANFKFKNHLLKPFMEIKSISFSSESSSSFYLNRNKITAFTHKVGINILVIDNVYGTILFSKNFNTVESDDDSVELANVIRSLPSGSIVAIATQGASTNKLNIHLRQAIDECFRGELCENQSSLIYRLKGSGSYCAIGQVITNGETPIFSESLSLAGKPTTCSLRCQLKYLFQNVPGNKFTVASKGGSDGNGCGGAQITINGTEIIGANGPTLPIDGLNVVVLKHLETKPIIHQYKVLEDENLWFSFYQMVNDLPKGSSVLVAIQKSMGTMSGLNRYYKKTSFRMIGGALYNNTLYNFASYAIIGRKGIAPSNAHELRCDQSSLLSISSWEPQYKPRGDQVNLIGVHSIFSVPVFEELMKLSPVPVKTIKPNTEKYNTKCTIN
ncbi:hypothetical protein CYY_000723 [Polysphondylium violaceum]|uniref:ILEI/PANDER domain-containing protein n=1 Tax=Polysphondylium violaceum TaxID=133409 RepID=A0A8J4VBA6_9MYCE|nr:hypothetical protein CYY_000723 [Polysphondylium violaceum]